MGRVDRLVPKEQKVNESRVFKQSLKKKTTSKTWTLITYILKEYDESVSSEFVLLGV
jgi:hypothetical protein